MSELTSGSASVDIATDEGIGLDLQLKELHNLSAEMVDLFHTLTFSPDTFTTPADVCSAFSEIILAHWDLCCIAIYLRDDDGRLQECAIHTHEHFDETKARAVNALFAAEAESEGRELQAWLDDIEASVDVESRPHLRQALEDMGLRAGVAVPIFARGALVGALVAVTVFPERLRGALNGLRFLAAPVVIGVGNARRAAAMREQHQHIGHLVEQLQRHGDALEEANRELRHVAHYRSLFLSRMSHELRTPLTSILGFAEILLDHEELSDCQRRFCEKIQSSGLQLRTSLNQLVDLSRLEGGQSELFLHEFSLSQLLTDSCAGVERLAEKQSVKIDCIADGKASSIVSDEGKLRQVLYNFLAHAIYRSPDGATVHIRVKSPSSTRFEIAIEDAGGPPSDIFHTLDAVELTAPSESAATMTELGLVISRRLIDLLGGNVMLENLQPIGLRVVIELPIRPTEIPQELEN